MNSDIAQANQPHGSYLRIIGEAMFGRSDYQVRFARLQDGSAGVLLDLRATLVVKPDLLAQIASVWPPEAVVPRLGILLPFDSWAVLQDTASRQLKPLTDRGIVASIFYSQQAESVPRWFAGEQVLHDVPAVIAWLKSGWRSTVLWNTILRTAATLIEQFGDLTQAPHLLVELATVALSFGKDGSAEARTYLETALRWLGSSESPVRCRAWTALATVARGDGDIAAALSHLEQAIAVAAQERHWTEGARALAESGIVLLGIGKTTQAERRFRQALVCLSADEDPKLRVLLHDNLWFAMHENSRRTRQALQVVGAELSAASATVDVWCELFQRPLEGRET